MIQFGVDNLVKGQNTKRRNEFLGKYVSCLLVFILLHKTVGSEAFRRHGLLKNRCLPENEKEDK